MSLMYATTIKSAHNFKQFIQGRKIHIYREIQSAPHIQTIEFNAKFMQN